MIEFPPEAPVVLPARKIPRYKLGSQLDFMNPELFEWNLCLLDERGVHAVLAIPLGTHSVHCSVVRAARELVKELNGEA